MTIRALQEVFQKRLNSLYDLGEINSFFFLLSESYLHKTRLDIALDPNKIIHEDSLKLFYKALAQLTEAYQFNTLLEKQSLWT